MTVRVIMSTYSAVSDPYREKWKTDSGQRVGDDNRLYGDNCIFGATTNGGNSSSRHL